MTQHAEHVVLVNSLNEKLGLADKATVHTEDTPMHRAFSLFLFNARGELLIQQRSFAKKTWPGAWSNSCCGHPQDGESFEAAAARRLSFELGIEAKPESAHIIVPDYTYRYARYGVVEHEFCPILVMFKDAVPQPNPDEVAAFEWMDWREFQALMAAPNDFSEWCVEETHLLSQNKKFLDLFDQHVALVSEN